MRTVDEFQKAVADRGLSRFILRDCSMCGYPLGYVFHADGRLGFDSGCDCVTYGPVVRDREWDELADHYNRQSNAEYIATMDEFFGFEPSNDGSK